MRKGRCTNFGNCGIADRREVVNVAPGMDMVCTECRRQLSEIDKPSAVPIQLMAGIVGLLLLAGLGLGYWFWTHRSPASPASTGAAVVPTPSSNGRQVLLRLSGSNTIGAKLAPALAEAYLKSQGAKSVQTRPLGADEFSVEGDGKVIEIRAHGTATAFEDLGAAKCDIGMASRSIKSPEAAKLASLGDMTSPASEHVLGLDGLAVIVNRSNSLTSIAKEDVAKIFSGEITDWKQVLANGGAIRVYARDEKSGTYDTFKTLVLGTKPLVSSAVRIEDSRELSEKIASDPDGIGFVGLPFIANAKALAISEKGTRALLPTPLTVATEDYILSRRLFLYTAANPSSPAVRDFISFALSKPGQDVVANIGFVGQNVKAQTVTTTSEGPADYQRIIQGAERLSLDFRFRTGSSALDNKALADLDRVTSFISDLHYTGQDIYLFGFADSTGTRDTNVKLSEDRAHAVADQFGQRGLNAKTIRGFGPDLPVASNQTEEGREKNRRVEIWIKKRT